MDPIFDLLGGLPRVALSPSHILNGEVTTPYGQNPSQDGVEKAWRDLAGDRPTPPWILLGPRDTPNGTVWRLGWCPGSATSPPAAEIVLPDDAWALERLSDLSGREGWHVRILPSPRGTWVGLWEGARCDHLHGPCASEEASRARILTIAAKAGIVPGAEIRGTWREPSPRDLRELAAGHPEADLLPVTESVRRAGSRSDRVALARVLGFAAIFLLVTLGFAAVQAVAWRMRASQESRLESVRPLLDRSAALRENRSRLEDSIGLRRDALAPNSSADRILSGIARHVPEGASLQVLALERLGSGWRMRTEARLSSWDQVQPFAQALRTVAGVSKVSIASQARSGTGVTATLELEGRWP